MQASSTAPCPVARPATSRHLDCRAAALELRTTLSADHALADIAHALVFFSSSHDATALAASLAEAFPGVPITGCMTAGEITPDGLADGAVVMIALPGSAFRVHAALLPDVDTIGVEAIGDRVRGLRAKLQRDAESTRRVFAMLMIDGLSTVEERVVAAIHVAIDGIPLVGGSAGDGLAFRRSLLIHEGVAYQRAALVLLIETDIPFAVFKTSNFEPTGTKLVVTSADAETRTVHELNAEPAAIEYASAIGLLPADLGPFSFASYPLVVKVGGDYYCRSIRNMNPDGSLTFFCAIDEGLVFTVARPQDLVSSAETALQSLEAQLGGIEMVLGFDCILRRLDAENRQVSREVDQLYKRYRVVGFHTYGEQFGAMHLNQTLTGIAFGRRTAAP